jgi:hypothetical protein
MPPSSALRPSLSLLIPTLPQSRVRNAPPTPPSPISDEQTPIDWHTAPSSPSVVSCDDPEKSLIGPHNQPAPIFRLPIEIILAIFTLCRDLGYAGLHYNEHSFEYLRVAEVCSTWRQAALAHTPLWTRVSLSGIEEYFSSPHGLHRIKIVLSRSGNQPLTIALDGINDLKVITLLLEQSSRIEDFRWTSFGLSVVLRWLNSISVRPAPILHTLVLMDTSGVLPFDFDDRISVFGGTFSCLRRLSLSSVPPEWYIGFPNTSIIQNLHVDLCSRAFRPASLCSMLQAMPQLQSLSLAIIETRDYLEPRLYSGLPTVQLDNLQVLSLRCLAVIMIPVLNVLHLPSLQRASLTLRGCLTPSKHFDFSTCKGFAAALSDLYHRISRPLFSLKQIYLKDSTLLIADEDPKIASFMIEVDKLTLGAASYWVNSMVPMILSTLPLSQVGIFTYGVNCISRQGGYWNDFEAWGLIIPDLISLHCLILASEELLTPADDQSLQIPLIEADMFAQSQYPPLKRLEIRGQFLCFTTIKQWLLDRYQRGLELKELVVHSQISSDSQIGLLEKLVKEVSVEGHEFQHSKDPVALLQQGDWNYL